MQSRVGMGKIVPMSISAIETMRSRVGEF